MYCKLCHKDVGDNLDKVLLCPYCSNMGDYAVLCDDCECVHDGIEYETWKKKNNKCYKERQQEMKRWDKYHKHKEKVR